MPIMLRIIFDYTTPEGRRSTSCPPKTLQGKNRNVFKIYLSQRGLGVPLTRVYSITKKTKNNDLLT